MITIVKQHRHLHTGRFLKTKRITMITDNEQEYIRVLMEMKLHHHKGCPKRYIAIASGNECAGQVNGKWVSNKYFLVLCQPDEIDQLLERTKKWSGLICECYCSPDSGPNDKCGGIHCSRKTLDWCHAQTDPLYYYK